VFQSALVHLWSTDEPLFSGICFDLTAILDIPYGSHVYSYFGYSPAKGFPVDIRNEISACAGQDDDLVCSILRNTVEGLDKFRVCMCGHKARAAVGVKLNRKYTAAVTR